VNAAEVERQERQRAAERAALAEVRRQLEAGLIPARPGRYVVTVEEIVTSP
jgi:hypothetical protein